MKAPSSVTSIELPTEDWKAALKEGVKFAKARWPKPMAKRSAIYRYLDVIAVTANAVQSNDTKVMLYLEKKHGLTVRATDDVFSVLVKATSNCSSKQQSKLWRFLRAFNTQNKRTVGEYAERRGGINAALEKDGKYSATRVMQQKKRGGGSKSNSSNQVSKSGSKRRGTKKPARDTRAIDRDDEWQ